MVIDIPHIAPSNGLHELGNRQRLARCHPQIYVVGHQHEAMYLAVVPLSRLASAFISRLKPPNSRVCLVMLPSSPSLYRRPAYDF
jgi:hypothetical protein